MADVTLLDGIFKHSQDTGMGYLLDLRKQLTGELLFSTRTDLQADGQFGEQCPNARFLRAKNL